MGTVPIFAWSCAGPGRTPGRRGGTGVAVPHLAEITWTEAAALDRERTVAILPVGAVEAHGPHLPLGTDGLIAEAMAAAGARRLETRGFTPLILPTLSYTRAGFAAAFPGTLSVAASMVTALLVEVGTRLAEQGFRCLALANAHLDPEHVRSLLRAAQSLQAEGGLRVAFPDLTRRTWARRLTAEFQSGACHAGQFEGSLVLALRPDLVREAVRLRLAPNPRSLSQAIRQGQRTFEEAGGPQAYFGFPAQATAEEGRATLETLGSILEEAVLEALA